ncbi:MAG: hypothetical protein NC340_04350 [Ruminococcus flavefaciens]|nr:hypothetical protein [Ruminococcus flavefaciens]MCM1229105.1 hypothetical protein [Ruminococcus flavefaciens]
MDGQYNNPYNYSQYNIPQPKKPMWASVTSFVLSLVNIVLCCCTTYILAPVSIILGIISLAKKWAGKGLAIAGIVISSLALILTIISSVFMSKFQEPYEDMMKFAMSPDKYIEEYQETGDVPKDFQKYCDPEYDSWWKAMGYDSFDEFFDDYMEGFMDSYSRYGYGDYSNSRSDNSDRYDNDSDDFFNDFGESPVDL